MIHIDSLIKRAERKRQISERMQEQKEKEGLEKEALGSPVLTRSYSGSSRGSNEETKI